MKPENIHHAEVVKLRMMSHWPVRGCDAAVCGKPTSRIVEADGRVLGMYCLPHGVAAYEAAIRQFQGAGAPPDGSRV